MSTLDFWDWVDAEIDRRGLSYYRIEMDAGLSNAAVSRPARNRTQPTLAVCKAIALAFEIAPEDVLRKARLIDPLPPPVREEEEAIKLLRALSPQARQSALAMLKGLREGERGGPGGRPAGRDWFPETMAALPEGVTQAQLRDVVMAEIRRIVDEDSADDVAVLASLFQQYASLRKAIQKQEEAEPAN